MSRIKTWPLARPTAAKVKFESKETALTFQLDGKQQIGVADNCTKGLKNDTQYNPKREEEASEYA